MPIAYRHKTFPVNTPVAPVAVNVTFWPNGYADGNGLRHVRVNAGESIHTAIFKQHGSQPLAKIERISEVIPSEPYEMVTYAQARAYTQHDNT